CMDSDCRSITPPPPMPRLVGDVWKRDAQSRIFADVQDHKATIRMEAADATDKKISLLIAVASDAANTPVGFVTITNLVIPVKDSKVVSTTLMASSSLSPSNVAQGAFVWPPATGATMQSSCVAIAQLDSDNNIERTLIVPELDRDCDGKVAADDCLTNVYDQTSTLGPDTDQLDKTCAILTNPMSCVIGTIGCPKEDVQQAADNTCRPQVDLGCLPKGVCDGCKDMSLADCSANVPHMACTLPRLDVRGCGTSKTINLKVPSNITRCNRAEIAAATDTLTFDTHAEFEGIELDVEATYVDVEKACALTLSWKGGSFTGLPPDSQHALIRIETSKGSVLIPLDVTFAEVAQCKGADDSAIKCEAMGIDTDDTLWACLGP
ncbi:MAG TPA: hypothetical protein VGC42_03800, partial [Kofleriaceae bacterium]